MTTQDLTHPEHGAHLHAVHPRHPHAHHPHADHPHAHHPHADHPHAHHPHAHHPHMKGREQVNWSEEVWQRLDAAVHEEMTRARVAAKFLPIVHVPAKTLTVPTDTVSSGAHALSVEEGTTTRLNELWVEFVLTAAQVEHEAAEEKAMAHGHGASTAITLATRAANLLAQAEDTLIFQGQNALRSPLFAQAKVSYRPNNLVGFGLLHMDPALEPDQNLFVPVP